MLADENVPRPIIEELRREGIDVVSIAELAPGTDDRKVFARAVKERRALLSFDTDFGEASIANASQPWSVILVRPGRLTLNAVIRQTVDAVRDSADWQGKIVVIEPGRSRTRAL